MNFSGTRNWHGKWSIRQTVKDRQLLDRLHGREYDTFTGLQYSRARMYDPKLGRFISEDPIGFGGGDINLYGYVRNMPLWYRDPRGLQPGADVMSQPPFWQGLAAGAAVVAPYVPPVAVAAGGAAAIYGATYVGDYTANHPYNPLVRGPWPLNPFKPPFGYPEPVYPTPTTAPRPYCEPAPRAIPFARAPTIPWPDSEPDREGCHEEISDCKQLCERARYDDSYHGKFGGRGGVWNGSYAACMSSCITERCKKGTGFR